MANQIANPLNSLERTTLRNCEKTIKEGCQTFIEVGEALAEIRDGELFRETNRTFRAYCKERWDFSDSRARQLIGGAERAKVVESVTRVTPSSEKQTRPLSQLPQEKQSDAWADAVEEADGDQPTTEQVQEAVERHKPPAKAKPPKKLDKGGCFKQWERAIGPVVRLVDKIAGDVGEKDCPSHKVVLGQLEAATEEVQEWLGVAK